MDAIPRMEERSLDNVVVENANVSGHNGLTAAQVHAHSLARGSTGLLQLDNGLLRIKARVVRKNLYMRNTS